MPNLNAPGRRRDVDRADVDALGHPVGDGTVAFGEAGADRVVATHHLRSGDLAEVLVEALDDAVERRRSGRGDRPRCWSGSSRATAVRDGCRRSRRLRRRTIDPVHCAPVPTSVTSPPTTKLGRIAASARISMSIDVVVVLPCVPATASERAWAQIDASIPARVSTVTPVCACLVEFDVVGRNRAGRGDRIDTVDDGTIVADGTATPAARTRSSTGCSGDRSRTRRGPSRRARWRSRSSPVLRRRRRAVGGVHRNRSGPAVVGCRSVSGRLERGSGWDGSSR